VKGKNNNLPKDETKFTKFDRKNMKSTKIGGSCPFCRAKTPTSHEEMIKDLGACM
jgi:hypothetical protein